MGRAFIAVVAALSMLLVATPAEAKAKAHTVAVYSWTDGDTVSTSAGIVRLVGIDTPETGTCGSDQATALARQLAPEGVRVRLLPAGNGNTTDKYGRLLRYVKSNGVDIGLAQIRAGAVARYDGLDGYPKHPKQKKYRKVDARNPNYCAVPAPFATDGAYAPVAGTWNCPSHAPIKGNQGSPDWIYHKPGQQYYNATNPEQCFATESAAQNAGYRPAKV